MTKITEKEAQAVCNIYNEYDENYEEQRDSRWLIESVLNAVGIYIEGVNA